MGDEASLTAATSFRVPDHVLTRAAGDESVILNLDNEYYYGLDPIGSRFWELIAAGAPFGSTVTTLLDEYEVDRATLVRDLTAVVGDLLRHGLVRIE
jgi:hypothetical protein